MHISIIGNTRSVHNQDDIWNCHLAYCVMCVRLSIMPLTVNQGCLPQKKWKRGRPGSKSAPASISLLIIKKTRKHWTNESMVSALKVVKIGTLVLCAAVTYNIPKQTLHDSEK